PKLYVSLEDRLRRQFGLPAGYTLPSFLTVGSWIGGDRDGNPFVDADTLTYAVSHQARVAFEHYLHEVHALGSELSVSSRLVTPTPALWALAAAAADPNPQREDEPYRRALLSVYARLAETARQLVAFLPARPAHRPMPADAAA